MTTRAAPQSPIPHAPASTLEAFAARLPREAQVLCSDPGVGDWLRIRGLSPRALDLSRDLRMLSLARESLDGIWVGGAGDTGAFNAISIEDAQRVVATFFKALRPTRGVLCILHPYAPLAFESMLRQNGFHILTQAERPGLTWALAQRI